MPRAWRSFTATEQYPAWRRALLGALLALLARAAAAGELRATVTSADGQPLADAVVVAIAADGGASVPIAPPPPAEATVDQIDKEFVPYVKVVRAGTAVHFPNKDHIRHHVYSFSPARVFELPLYAGTPAEPVVFDKPGIVTLGCNIHDWMIGYVYVTDSPWSGKTGEDGRVTIGALPPGSYRVRVWHPRMLAEESSTTAEVAVAGPAPANHAWKLELKPDLRRRRAPVMGTGGYR